MEHRIVWQGDHNLFAGDNLDDVEKIWITAGDYKIVRDGEKCYVNWGEARKTILALTPHEKEPGVWQIVMRQNPKMNKFLEFVMDGYAEMVMPVIWKALENEAKTQSTPTM